MTQENKKTSPKFGQIKNTHELGVLLRTDRKGQQLTLFEEQAGGESPVDVVEDLVKKKFGKNSISRAEGLRKTEDFDRWFE